MQRPTGRRLWTREYLADFSNGVERAQIVRGQASSSTSAVNGCLRAMARTTASAAGRRGTDDRVATRQASGGSTPWTAYGSGRALCIRIDVVLHTGGFAPLSAISAIAASLMDELGLPVPAWRVAS